MARVPDVPPAGGGTRRGWIAVVLVALVVGTAAGLGAGAGVAATVRAANTTTVNFSPDTSVFHGMDDVQAVLARVLPSVVAIQAFGPSCASGLFGGATQSEEGSGMILTRGGEILTNDHVIANATQITVTLHGQKTAYPATLLGTDPSYDVALLQMHGPTTLRAVSFGDSSTIRVGEDVLAIGNALALSQSTPSVTEGIISAEGRSITSGGQNCAGTESLSGLLQTQAPINPGNSGGPLVDSAGQVIGMNTAAATTTAGDAPTQNIGFAIPIGSIRALIPGLEKGGTVGEPKAFLGVEVVSVTPSERATWGLTATSGALVVSVFPGAPAELAGIAAGEVIVGFAGRVITTDVSLTAAVRAAHPGQRVTIELYRGPTLVTISVVLGIKPAPEAGSS
ncbi:MAG: trypsin-like peptidase domain-containing protein [Acidimicrobiales bacterium]